MKWSRRPDDPNCGPNLGKYHHGNLKSALVKAARELIAEFGPSGFSLTEAARRAGVSSAAPYRHFRDRQSLIAEVVRQGFEALMQVLGEAQGEPRPGVKPDAWSDFDRLETAYLNFARREPAAFAAMFSRQLLPGERASPQSSEQQVFELLVAAVGRLAAEQTLKTPVDQRKAAGAITAIIHGFALMALRPPETTGAAADTTGAARDAILVYLKGLGIERRVGRA